MRKSISTIESEIDAIPNGHEDVEACEKLIIKYGKILHPNHYLQIKLKDILVAMYGVRLISRNNFQGVAANYLERRFELCQSILSVLDVIQPGLNRGRAMILYEMYTSANALIKINWNSLTNREKRIDEANKYFEECVRVFEWEDESSIEHALFKICYQLSENMKTMLMNEICEI